MEIKYDPVFGDQSLFDGAPEDAEAVGGCKPHLDALVFYKFSDGEFQYKYEDDWKVSICKHPQSVIKAMRRIIPEPKHWTWADKEAGKLPPVGGKYLAGSNKREFTCLFHGKGNGAVIVVGFNSDDEVTGYQLQYCYPIESPAEKAQRLREEWKNNVIEIHHGKRRKMSTSTFLLDDIYDALLTGELKAPEVE